LMNLSAVAPYGMLFFYIFKQSGLQTALILREDCESETGLSFA